MNIMSFEVGPFMENTYLISHDGSAIVIDPGFADQSEFSSLTSALKTSGDQLIAVVLTHAHIDHVMGIQRLRKEFDVPVYLSESDRFLWNNFDQQTLRFGFEMPAFDFSPDALPESGTFEVGNFQLECLFTPGHSPDHISLYFKEAGFVVAGDALFRESIGRTDLYKGDFDLLAESIREKLYTLPDDTTVYPGHGPATKIGYEKANNPFVKARVG